jgi:hypothetical protein
MGAKLFKSILIVLILIALSTMVSGCPWEDDSDDPSPMTKISPKPTQDPDDEDPTSTPKITPKPYEPKGA